MSRSPRVPYVVGVDGCPFGWVTLSLDRAMEWRVSVLPHAVAVWEEHADAELLLIDVPIGLAESRQRACDREAKTRLGRRGASVFLTPCREAVAAETYEEASRINEERTGSKLSKQTWNIVPKIRQVDDLLRDTPEARGRIREMHPELCFAALAGEPMKAGKATPEGETRRIELLESVGVPARAILAAALPGRSRRELAEDDVLDAAVGAFTALAGPAGLVSIPDPPEHDATGLRMEMVFRPSP